MAKIPDTHTFAYTFAYKPFTPFPRQCKQIDAPARVVGIISHKGHVYVATEAGVFVIDDQDRLVPLKFAPAEPKP